ncbi:MAG: nitroreductase family deazaflavin-dependent oxidoreductase [Candidatus Promineifilaceae bacterium]
MPTKIADARPPQGMKRLMFRAPLWIYRLGLGSLLGGRFLLLHHTGRTSGSQRQTVLEVVDFDPQTGTYYIASGFGKASDWYKNILKTPQVSIQVGSKTYTAVASPLSPDESGEMMVAYARRHPTAAKELMRFCGFEVDGSEDDYRSMGSEHIPFVALNTSP